MDDSFHIVKSSDWKVEMKNDDAVLKRAYLPDYKRSVFLGEVHSSKKVLKLKISRRTTVHHRM